MAKSSRAPESRSRKLSSCSLRALLAVINAEMLRRTEAVEAALQQLDKAITA